MQFEGVCPEEHKRLVRELAETQRKCVSNELDLRAALDKLEVFRRTEAALQTSRRAAASGDRADASISGEGDSVSDEGKTESELLAELSHLRHAVARDAEELNKVMAHLCSADRPVDVAGVPLNTRMWCRLG